MDRSSPLCKEVKRRGEPLSIYAASKGRGSVLCASVPAEFASCAFECRSATGAIQVDDWFVVIITRALVICLSTLYAPPATALDGPIAEVAGHGPFVIPMTFTHPSLAMSQPTKKQEANMAAAAVTTFMTSTMCVSAKANYRGNFAREGTRGPHKTPMTQAHTSMRSPNTN